MAQGSRPDRVADQIRAELAALLMREVRDPGIGFITLTRVSVSPDLQNARVLYTVLGDAAARSASAKALTRAVPFLRRQIGGRLRLRRTPDLHFVYDDSIEGQDRVERLLDELRHDLPSGADTPDAPSTTPQVPKDPDGDHDS
jgi:ribosome-binding factor A